MAGRQKKKDAAILGVAGAVDNLVTQLGELDRFDAIRGTDDHRQLELATSVCSARILAIARRHGGAGIAEKVWGGPPEDEPLEGDPSAKGGPKSERVSLPHPPASGAPYVAINPSLP